MVPGIRIYGFGAIACSKSVNPYTRYHLLLIFDFHQMKAPSRGGGAAQPSIARLEKGLDILQCDLTPSDFEEGSYDVSRHMVEKTVCSDFVYELMSMLGES
jgi:hypothetical protein